MTQTFLKLVSTLMFAMSAQGQEVLLLSEQFEDLDSPEVTVEQMNYSLTDGVLNIWGPVADPGIITFIWDVDISGYTDIRTEFTYRRSGTDLIWESNDWVQLITVDENNGIFQYGVLWNFRPPEQWTVRSEMFDDSSWLGEDRIRVGFHARTTAPTEIIQIDSFRIYGNSILLCPADLTGDSVLDFFDVSVFLTYFQLGNEIADFTGDGSFDFFDVSAFLTAFSAGCP